MTTNFTRATASPSIAKNKFAMSEHDGHSDTGALACALRHGRDGHATGSSHRQERLCYSTLTLRRLMVGLQGLLGHVAVADSTHAAGLAGV